MANEAQVLMFSPLYKIIPYRVLKWTIVVIGTYIYYTCFNWSFLFALIMIPMFAYLFCNITGLIIHFFIYLFSSPLLLSEEESYIEEGIPSDCKVVFFRPIFAGSNGEMETVLVSMEQDIINNQEPNKNLKFIVIDNTRNDDVKKYTQKRIKELQDKYGDDVVFYFHRNVKCDFFKKVGIYMDAILFLYEGHTRPKMYTDPKWAEWAKETRNPELPLWDVILGDINALGIKGSIEDVLAGKDIEVDEEDKIKVSFVSDADNVWPEGQIRKMVAKIMHPSNSHISIYQPMIELSNPDENAFIKVTSWARQMYGFDLIAKWRLYHFSPFFGKGAMHVENYVNELIKTEWLHPGKAASHDFQEALRGWAVCVEDVYILEKTFSNKLAELMRGALWQWGDLETVENYVCKGFEPGRKTHLFVLLNNLINNPIYSLWVVGQCFAWMFPSIFAQMTCPRRLFFLFAVILLSGIVVPLVAVPIITKYKERTYPPVHPPISDLNVLKILWVACIELVVMTLVNMLDLVYKTKAIFQNIKKQITGKAYVWKTGAMSEMETANATLPQVYKTLYVSTIIGAVLFFGSITVFPGVVGIFLLPYTASFLLGPLVIWITAKPRTINIK